MPRKQQISREQIARSAFEIVRENGGQALSARVVAQRLGCSTQPVYSYFPSMSELENEVRKMAEDMKKSYLLDQKDDYGFLSMGLGYVEFGWKEPELFKFLFFSGKLTGDLFDDTELIESMKKDQFLQSLTEESLFRILEQMWIFTHGLTMILINDPEAYTPQEVFNYLHEMGEKVIIWEINRQIDPESMKGSCTHENHSFEWKPQG
ncbi:TetR/AcrR family transcriptional regulator [Myxococcota bacterium]|nr:TetR/AcrR family transcriptional regulator [Myxococcota bacterium]MBU1381850.1 TetR/AcrR family transcriptional regulator [Myxococcota bacterium]MBU1495585.1 TetR/AcrR family transcriptional regulator [Myxococcota bacterium]